MRKYQRRRGRGFGGHAASGPAIVTVGYSYSQDFTVAGSPTDAGFTFARSGVAWSSVGASFAQDIPRLVSGSGLLLEGARTNLLVYSSDLGQYTGFNTNTITLDQEVAPDGTTTVDFFDTVGTGSRERPVTTVEGSSYAFSAWLRRRSGGTGDPALRHTNSATGATTIVNPSATLTRYTTVVLGRVAGGSVSFGIRSAATSTCAYWGGQVELAPFSSTGYLPTNGTTVTRNAETCTASRTSTPSAVMLKLTAAPGIGSDNQVGWQYDDGTANNRLTIRRATDLTLICEAVVAGVAVAQLSLGTLANGASMSLGFMFSANAFHATTAGGVLQSDTTGAMPTGLTTERLGHGETSTSQWFGYIQKYQIQSAAITTTALQTAVDAL